MLKRRLKQVGYGVLALVLLGLIPLGVTFSAGDEQSFNSFVEALKDPARIEIEEVTSQLPDLMTSTAIYQSYNYAEVREHFQKSLDSLRKLFAPGVIGFNTLGVLTGFPDKRTVFNVYSYPVSPMLITVPLYDRRYIRYDKMQIEFGGKIIPGLRFTSVLPRPYLERQAPARFELGYAEDLNARLAGFGAGQLILPLSMSVEPGGQFDYNGLRDWSQHKRYKREDQVSRPIALTNFAHDIGENYLVSDHPDFSLTLTEGYKEGVRMTFFLWRYDPLSAAAGRFVALPAKLPDFVFQFFLVPG